MDIAILNIHGVDYHCIINGIDKYEAIHSLQNVYLTKKREIVKKLKKT